MRTRTITRQEAFLKIFQVCRSIQEDVHWLDSLGTKDRPYFTQVPTEDGPWKEDWGAVVDKLRRLRTNLSSPLLSVIDQEVMTAIDQNLRWAESAMPMKAPAGLGDEVFIFEKPEHDPLSPDWPACAMVRIGTGDVPIFREAVAYLEGDTRRLDAFLEEMAISAFGHWGMYWFMLLVRGPRHFVDSAIRIAHIADVPPEEVLAVWRETPVTEPAKELAIAIEERDRWVYEQAMAGARWPAISKQLRDKPLAWKRVSTAGIRDIAKRYAKKHGLPRPRRRSPGRPANS